MSRQRPSAVVMRRMIDALSNSATVSGSSDKSGERMIRNNGKIIHGAHNKQGGTQGGGCRRGPCPPPPPPPKLRSTPAGLN